MTVRPGPLDATAVVKDMLDRLRRLEAPPASIVLRSPNGTKYRLRVADDGSLTTEPV